MTARTPDILEDGALVVRDFVTPAEERRILQRFAEAPWSRDLNRRVQHYGFRYDYRSPGAREPASPFPLWAQHMARAAAGVLRRRLARAVHRERVPPGAGHRHARRSPGLRRRRRVAVARGRLADAVPAAQHAPVRSPRRAGRPGPHPAAPLGARAQRPGPPGVDARIDPSDTANRRVTRVSATFRTLAG